MPFIIDDVLLGIPVFAAIWRSVAKLRSANSVLQQSADEPTIDVAACRAAVPVEPRLTATSAMLSGHMYSGQNAEHVSYLKDYLDWYANEVSGEDRRRVLAFRALQGREGSTSAINTYDNQILTWGTGWGGLGGLGGVMDRLSASDAVMHSMAACGVHYLGSGAWSVIDDDGNAIEGKQEALRVIRSTPALLNLFIRLAEDEATRDVVTNAQLEHFMATSGQIAGSETIATQALFNFAAHLKHWAPAYMRGVVEEAAQRVPGEPSVERDKRLAPEIIKGFYARTRGWVPDWRQMQKYAVGDMRADGLDVSADPVVAAPAPPVAKTVAGCGNFATFKHVGGCGNYDHLSDDTCGNWGHWGAQYRPSTPHETYDVKVVGGAGYPPGFEQATEVYAEPELSWEGYVQGPGAEPTAEQLATIKRGISTAVAAGENDAIAWTQIRVESTAGGPVYDLMVTNEPIAVRGLRLPTSFDDAVQIANLLGALPITPAISDARWSSAKRVHAKPLTDSTGAIDYRAPGGPDQVVRYNARMGLNTGEFRDGFWKEVVVHPGLQPSGRGSMAQYGFRDSDSHMFERGGPSNHFKEYADYSDTPTYVSRRALKDGVEVDLLDEYAAGGTLIGALPQWLVDKFRKAVA